MVASTPPHLSLEQRERLEQLADAARLRVALYPSPKPPPAPTAPAHRDSPCPLIPGGGPVRCAMGSAGCWGCTADSARRATR
ncbi:hypothetical protein GCM10018793_70060 [Streptomyces sulfonofaciens]|uniref:Uncharacterized protein n=1 Tax=Streptomyces sulfonofaciens TaxID=68272 RepID=A0A919GQ16_9ACTN|nr:hypothetical protein GCM10018793_70060 [Streptomyces sulfonofaciens]